MARGSDLKIYQISTVIRRMMSTVMLLKGTSFSELSMRMLMRAFWGLQRGRYKITTQRSGCDFERRSDGVGKRSLFSGRALNAIRDDEVFPAMFSLGVPVSLTYIKEMGTNSRPHSGRNVLLHIQKKCRISPRHGRGKLPPLDSGNLAHMVGLKADALRRQKSCAFAQQNIAADDKRPRRRVSFT